MANTDQIDKIINIRFNYDELVHGWKQASTAIADNKKNLKELQNEFKAGQMSADEYKTALLEIKSTNKALTDQVRAYEKEIQNNIKIETKASGSIAQLQANVSKLTVRYKELSAAERESPFGQNLAADIKSQQEALNEAEASLGNYRSQVGSYEGAIKRALGVNGPFVESLIRGTNGANGFTSAIKTTVTALKVLVKQALAFIATPLVAVLAALAITLSVLRSRFEAVNSVIEKSERVSDKYRLAQSSVNAILAATDNALERQAEKLTKVTSKWEMFKAALKAIMDLGVIEGFKAVAEGLENAPAFEKLEGKYIKLRDYNRRMLVENTQIEAQISDLRNKAMQKEVYTAEQRKKFIEEAIALNYKLFDNQKKAVGAQLRLLRKEQELSPTDTATNDAIAEMQARLTQLTAQSNLAEKELQSQINATTSDIKRQNNEIDKAIANAQKAADEVYNLILDLRDKTRDNEILNLQEEYDREVAATRSRLEAIANLTDMVSISERESLDQKLLLLHEKLLRDTEEVNDRYRKEELDKEIAASEERNRQILLNQQIKIGEAQSRVLDVRLNGGSALDEASALINVRQAELNAALENIMLIDMAEADSYTSEQERDAARLAAVNRLKEAQIALADSVQRTIDLQRQEVIQTVQAAVQMFGSFSSMFEALGGEGEKYAAFVKAFSVMEVVLAQAVAIANAWSGNAKLPFPANIFATASSIAAIIAAIANATQQVNSTKTPKYAQGGLVTGPGTGTSDSIPAMLSNGEAVMTARAVSDWGPILSAMNVSSGGNAITTRNLPERNDGMRGIVEALKEAVSELPAPQVAVTDINNGQRRVNVSTNLARLGGKRGR